MQTHIGENHSSVEQQFAGRPVTAEESTHLWIPGTFAGLHLFFIRAGVSGKVLDQRLNLVVETQVLDAIRDAQGYPRHPQKAGRDETVPEEDLCPFASAEGGQVKCL